MHEESWTYTYRCAYTILYIYTMYIIQTTHNTQYTYAYTYLHDPSCMHTYTHAYIHACIHTRMHTYTYTHTYIHHVYDCMRSFFVNITSVLIIYIYTYSLLILYIIIYDICIHTLWASCNAMIWWLRWDWGSTWIACPIAFVRNMWSDHCFSSAAGNLTSDNGF